ncbi:hypothetical protein TcasGA2_TC015306 [Tribolium castaneum]|uniref:Transposable element P transposase-like C-terminal domain-containing protein n=1 Tax=Tribolium castaneum TaxID=7070 RepID=D2A4U1_TRICA|nr:hypothetical protein TcasGA2_TC015306 [Tribolium castaneum]
MHLHFERTINAKSDCSILSLTWMGKVPDELPESSTLVPTEPSDIHLLEDLPHPDQQSKIFEDPSSSALSEENVNVVGSLSVESPSTSSFVNLAYNELCSSSHSQSSEVINNSDSTISNSSCLENHNETSFNVNKFAFLDNQDDSSVSREEEDLQMAQHEQAISFNPSELSDLPEEDTQALAYVAGWVLKSIDVPDCEHCRSTLYSGEITNRHILTSFRERDDVQRLTYASDAVMSLVQNLHDYLNEFLTSSGFQRNLEDTFKISFKQHLDFAESHCTEHPCYDLILEKAIPFLIFKFCRDRQRQKTISDGHRTKMKRLS